MLARRVQIAHSQCMPYFTGLYGVKATTRYSSKKCLSFDLVRRYININPTSTSPLTKTSHPSHHPSTTNNNDLHPLPPPPPSPLLPSPKSPPTLLNHPLPTSRDLHLRRPTFFHTLHPLPLSLHLPDPPAQIPTATTTTTRTAIVPQSRHTVKGARAGEK